MADPLDLQGLFVDALRPARNALCDNLAAHVWLVPKRLVVVAHAVADCIIRTVFARAELQALEPIRNAAARADARRVLERNAVPALDEAALRMLDKLDQLEFFSAERAFPELFSASGLVAMCLIRAERAGIQHIGERLAEMLEGLIQHQQRTATEADAKVLEERAYAALRGKRLYIAGNQFREAGLAYGAIDHPVAFQCLSNAAALLQQAGDLDGALAIVELALAAPAPNDRRGIAAMTKGMILDALDREDAIAAWQEAAQLQPSPPGVAFCLAHAFGALAKHSHSATLAELAIILERGEPMTNGQRAGVIGGAGQSAGPRRGLALLAQAVLVMCETPDAWNTSTTRFWSELILHMGDTTPAGLQLCGLGWALTSLQQNTNQYNALMEAVAEVFERCARARKISIDKMRELAVPRMPAGELIERVNRELRASIPGDRWLPQRATPPARPAGSLAGSGRVSHHHPRWVNGQYVTYFVVRSDGSWIAIAMLLVARPEGWLLMADTKEATCEMHLLIEPVAAANGSMTFRPVGWSRRRGEADEGVAVRAVTLITNLLEAADLAGVAHTPAPATTPLPYGLDMVHAFDASQHDFTVRHELSARIPITGLARSTIRDRAFALIVTSFGNSDPAVRSDAFDDHVDFSHPRRIEHDDGFALTYPATWNLKPLHRADIDSPSSVQIRELSAGGGGNVTAASCMVTLYTGSVAELDRLEHDMVARWSTRTPGRSGTFVPQGEHELGGTRAFVHAFEHPFQDGFDIAALVRSDDVLATVVVFWNVLKTHPQREQLLREAKQPARDIIASFQLLRAAAAAGRVLN